MIRKYVLKPLCAAIIQPLHLIPFLIAKLASERQHRTEGAHARVPPARSVILFHCHYLNKNVRREYEKIRAACRHAYDVVLLYDNRKNDFEAGRDMAVHLVENGFEKDRGYVLHREGLWFNPEYAVLDFYLKNPQYEYYWRLDHDVRFGGPWNNFFDHFLGNTADFISSFVRRHRRSNRKWRWWKEISVAIADDQKVASFFPVQRFSKRSLAFLDGQYRSGITGHCEVLVTTLLAAEGLVIEDIGKKWYDAFTLTFREIPVRKAGKLYHPVL